MPTRRHWIVVLLTVGLVSIQLAWFMLLEYKYFQSWHGYILAGGFLCLFFAQLYFLRSITKPLVWGLFLLITLLPLPIILVKQRVVCTIGPGLHTAQITVSDDYSILSSEYWSAPDLCAELRHPNEISYPL